MKRKKKSFAQVAGGPEPGAEGYVGKNPKKVFDDNLEKATYEVQFEAPNCIDSEVIECFRTNYVDELKCCKVFGDDTKYEIGRHVNM